MPLQDLICLRQADTVAVFLGGEIKLKNLVLYILSNAHAPVADLGHHHTFFAVRRNGELASFGHSLDSVEHDVEKSLLHKIYIRLDWQGLVRHVTDEVDAMLLGVRGG